MADARTTNLPTPQTPASVRPGFSIARVWQRISPPLVPVLAVITAMILSIPFMILTGGGGDVGRGLTIAGTAFSALIEGSIGITVNDLVTPDDLANFDTLARAEALDQRGLRAIALDAADAALLGRPLVDRFDAVIDNFTTLDDDQLTELGESVIDIGAIGADTLIAMRPLLADLGELSRSAVRDLVEPFAGRSALSSDGRAALEAALPSASTYSDADLLAYIQIVGREGIARLERIESAVELLQAENIAPDSPEATALAAVAAVEGGASAGREAIATFARLDAAGIDDPAALASEIAIIRELYNMGILTEPDVTTLITRELPDALANNLVVLRPGDRLIVEPGNATAGIITNPGANADDPSDDIPETVFSRIGGSALLFFPANLETMLVRATPFIIAGLAVALAFKAGLFNIGAEGQLYAGGLLAAWIGFTPLLDGVPIFIRLPLVIVGGIAGGFAFGAIPGALKAYTGAHEVITTIMLNYIAIRLVDWLIKSTNPVILLDTTASLPRTPLLNEAARLPALTSFPSWLFILLGVAMLALGLYQRREAIGRDLRYVIRPVIDGLIVALGGLFLAWVGSTGKLHIGFLIMLVTVWLTDWFLRRTTIGFELRTVGTNPDAARYAGMSVPRNTILAMALAGALAGLAGAVEVSGVQYNMQPEFFAGLGFDAIAVALLARNNPRSMIPAGLLWGALLAGAGLMQIRADIAIDLVKIIQALIIMFIAADMIIRFLWRVPDTGDRGAAMNTIKGWGG